MTDDIVTEHDDRWELQVSGRRVDRICVDHQFRLHLFYEPDEPGVEPSDDRPVEIVVGGPFTYLSATGTTHELDEPKGFGPALELLWMKVDEVSYAKEGGRLTVRFEDGALLEAPAMEQYEAWEIVGPDRLIIYLSPGRRYRVGGRAGQPDILIEPPDEESN